MPSPQSVVSDMLRYADVGAEDFLIDLGSGDGRIVLTAAKVFGARGFGVEIKDELVKKSNEAAKNEGLADRVKFMKQDLFKTDMSQATVITMYLLPDTVNLLKDKFLDRAQARHAHRVARLSAHRLDPGEVRADGPRGQGADQRRHHHADLPLRRAGEGRRQLERADAAGGEQAAGDAVAASSSSRASPAACASTARSCRWRT